MLQSMTGYGKAAKKTDRWLIEVEVRSVNNRYLDTRVKVPSMLAFAEIPVRNRISERLSRGRVELAVFVQSAEMTPQIDLRIDVLERLQRQAEEARVRLGMTGTVTLSDLLSIDGVLERTKPVTDEEQLLQDLLSVEDQALEHLCAMRRAEGERLAQSLKEKCARLETHLAAVRQRAPELVQDEFQRMKANVARLLENAAHVDEAVLANDIALYAQKSDIDEEMVRLASHLREFAKLLESSRAVGKTLDFLIQEMNREVNTMSSKSNDIALTNSCVEMKALIEQLREQIQNIE
ncbi:MAG: YicC/YloC family endoribonuclease [Ndongobacter sp.]|nr:YicC/YloC family endoribonuclease [Ndongobacter sp.]